MPSLRMRRSFCAHGSKACLPMRRNQWLDYLQWAFKLNRPWEEMAADILLARPTAPEETGAAWFLAEKKDDPNVMATETARTLLGKQIQCAQCHDHQISPEIEHRHYWGMVAFFTRTYRVKTPKGLRVAEAATGGYSEYKDLGGKSCRTIRIVPLLP